QAEDGIRDFHVTGVQTCALPIFGRTGLAYADTRRAGDLTQWDLLLAYFQASQVAEFFTTDTTYEELKSAGELGLIADLNLRNERSEERRVGKERRARGAAERQRR